MLCPLKAQHSQTLCFSTERHWPDASVLANERNNSLTGAHVHVTAADSSAVCGDGSVMDPETLVSSQSISDVTVHHTRE